MCISVYDAPCLPDRTWAWEGQEGSPQPSPLCLWDTPTPDPCLAPQYSMHCCTLGFLSCSLFLHMSFELKLLLLLLWLAASCSLFLHSHAWLSECLIVRLYLGPLDSRCAQPLDRGAGPPGMGVRWDTAELSWPH